MRFGAFWRPSSVIESPVWILAAPYCSGVELLKDALQDWGIVSRPDVQNLTQLSRFRPLITEANATVQRHLAPHVYMERHAARVRDILAPVTRSIAQYDLFQHGPLGQTVLHPYVCKAIAPDARLIWVSRKRKAWFHAVETLERAHPLSYPEYVGWEQNRAGREALLWERRRIERRKFLRLANAYPEHCLDLQIEDEDVLNQLRDFADQSPTRQSAS